MHWGSTWLVERTNRLLIRYVSSVNISGSSLHISRASSRSPSRWLSMAIPVMAWDREQDLRQRLPLFPSSLVCKARGDTNGSCPPSACCGPCVAAAQDRALSYMASAPCICSLYISSHTGWARAGWVLDEDARVKSWWVWLLAPQQHGLCRCSACITPHVPKWLPFSNGSCSVFVSAVLQWNKAVALV